MFLSRKLLVFTYQILVPSLSQNSNMHIFYYLTYSGKLIRPGDLLIIQFSILTLVCTLKSLSVNMTSLQLYRPIHNIDQCTVYCDTFLSLPWLKLFSVCATVALILTLTWWKFSIQFPHQYVLASKYLGSCLLYCQ